MLMMTCHVLVRLTRECYNDEVFQHLMKILMKCDVFGLMGRGLAHHGKNVVLDGPAQHENRPMSRALG